ncbi:MAG TPA: hypothetical protein VKR31_05325 [Rhizomicrobium sp.]|nr:hypothetical protein [Rhizomicrobium sp.]
MDRFTKKVLPRKEAERKQQSAGQSHQMDKATKQAPAGAAVLKQLHKPDDSGR